MYTSFLGAIALVSLSLGQLGGSSDNANLYDYVNQVEESELLSLVQTNRTSGNPDYALGSVDKSYYYSSDFQRPISYSRLPSLSSINVGDLVYERDQIGGIGHIGIVESVSYPSQYGNFIRTIEAVGDEVQYCFIDEERFVEKNMAILAVNNAYLYLEEAFYFINQQLGKPYYLDITTARTDIDSDTWYCSELLYAAFLYAGIDIAAGSGYQSGHCVLPNQIFAGSMTYQVWITKHFLTFQIGNKSWFTWNVTIGNSNQTAANALYNSKMCFEDAANNWTGLNDITSISIPAYSSATVQISENFFATHITACFNDGVLRYITAANNLSANGVPSMWFNYQWVS